MRNTKKLVKHTNKKRQSLTFSLLSRNPCNMINLKVEYKSDVVFNNSQNHMAGGLIGSSQEQTSAFVCE